MFINIDRELCRCVVKNEITFSKTVHDHIV